MNKVKQKNNEQERSKGTAKVSDKDRNTDTHSSFVFPWKILLCGTRKSPINKSSTNPNSSIKKWNIRQLIFKKNINVLNILQNSRKKDEGIASEIFSPVPVPDVECIPSEKEIDISSPPIENKLTKNLLDPIDHQDIGKKCLIIDLDETLVHSSFKFVESADFQVGVDIEGVSHQVYVLKRPYVDEFLSAMGDKFECVLFTASLSKYADPVADYIDKKKIFRHRLFREACVYHVGSYVKDLSLLGRPLDQIVILDNSPASFLFHPGNAIQISSWFDDKKDTALYDLIPYLEALSKEPSVTNYLNSNDPKGNGAASGIRGLSTHSNNNNNINSNISNNCRNIISQVSINNADNYQNSHVYSQKQHEEYTSYRGENYRKAFNRDSSISNYPIVTRKQLNCSSDIPITSESHNHRSTSTVKTHHSQRTPSKNITANETNRKRDENMPNKNRLIISESNQIRKDKFLKR